MGQQQALTGRVTVKQLIGGGPVGDVYRVGQVQRQTGKNGKDFLRVSLIDMTGQITAMVWDEVDRLADVFIPGHDIYVWGSSENNPQFGPQVKVRDARPATPDEYDSAALEEQPQFPLNEMISDYRQLVQSIKQPHLSALLEALLGEDTAAWEQFRDAPAAKTIHHAYKHGLLEHTLTVAKAVSAAAVIFPGIDHDLAVTSALLHDIGKLDAYATTDGVLDFTTDGRLQGEIPLGYFRIRNAIAAIDGFPPELAQSVAHIQLSHHGKLEHGSPVAPVMREAVLVHAMDNLGGTLGSFDRLEKALAPDTAWSQHDRAVGGFAYFGHSATDN
ncbi:MAG: HD domain-containing protein [Thermoleophilaceae bacterium]|nr:HD domain-containing protein [Thermoleophilaceae bacterium]